MAVTAMTLVPALGSRFVPSESPLGPAARMLDSLAPWLLALGAVGAVAVLAARARVAGGVLLTMSLAGAAGLAVSHRALSLPNLVGVEADLRLVFLNAQSDNAAYSGRMAAAALEADADVMVFVEGEALYDALPQIAETHEVVTRCDLNDCPLIIASRVPVLRAWQLTLNPIWPERYGVAELELADGRRIFISVAHLTKPFFSGVAETELDRLAAQYDWIDGPVVAVGDFNAAPWSRPVTRLLERTGYRATRRTPGTWPAQVGPLGVPIDLALVHNGARVVGIESFGGDLNSNHRGLLLDIAVPREQ